jgi:hypothetical protein
MKTKKKEKKPTTNKLLEILSHSLSKKVDPAIANKKISRKLIFLCYEPPHTLPENDRVAPLLTFTTNVPITFFLLIKLPNLP